MQEGELRIERPPNEQAVSATRSEHIGEWSSKSRWQEILYIAERIYIEHIELIQETSNHYKMFGPHADACNTTAETAIRNEAYDTWAILDSRIRLVDL